MPDDHYLEDLPGSGGEHLDKEAEPDSTTDALREDTKESHLLEIWEGLSRAGLGEAVLRFGTHLLSIALVLVVVWAMRAFYLRAQEENRPEKAAFAAELPTPVPTDSPPTLPSFLAPNPPNDFGIARMVVMHTNLPSRPRGEVITYEVQPGDTIFGIAEQFNLRPQTILWGNFYILGDNPHLLSPGQELNILPVDGTYHKWSAGEGLNGVAAGYRVTPDVIINWPGNRLTEEMVADLSNPKIEPGTWLVVPGGERDFVTWSAPRINRSNPAVARVLGPGSCGTIADGAVGIGAFIWPSNEHRLSGYDYSPSTNHFGIDIAGKLGDPIYTADNGVVVYAGWNNWGYGNVVVVDHGAGWQTLYAHLSYVGVGCGQSVYQGGVIGSFGSTGNSSGPHLHFEMLHESYGKVNPWNFLP
jgi:murein DD-endopeptidase MepM/ murein hydrolase activator NlpD